MSGRQNKFSVLLQASLFLLVVTPGVVFAQSTIDPKTVEFDPSADHSATTSTGTELVSRYDLEFYLVGAAQPFQTLSLGKPVVLSSGKVEVPLSSLGAMPSPGITYESAVAAVGPGGIGRSSRSNTFSFSTAAPPPPPPSCNYAASPTSQTIATSGGAGQVTVTAGTGCAWSATSNAGWLSITSGSSGSGAGTVAYTAAANTSTAGRTGTLTVAGVAITVQQAGTTAGCTATVMPTTQSVAASGGPASVSVSTSAGCQWSAASNTAWLTIGSGATGNGNGVVNYTVAANTGGAQRNGTLTVAGQTVSVTQNGVTSCTFSVSPALNTVGASGGATSFSVTAGVGCGWTATTSTSWLTLGNTSGTGTGSVAVTVQPNTSTLSRTGLLIVAGVIVNVKQNGTTGGCVATVAPTSQLFTSAGGNANVTVAAAESCSWTATSNTAWLTVTSGASGSGNRTVSYTAAANTTSSSRNGSLTVGGQTVSVTQSASSCTFTVSPSSSTIAANGGSTKFSVTGGANCSWTAATNTAWLTVTSGSSGTANGTVVVTAPANTSTLSRTGAVTIAGKIVNVKQDPNTCTYSVAPTSQTIAAAGDTASVTLTTTSGCSWTASSNASWLTIVTGSKGSGSGTVTFNVAANSSSSSRTATLTVGGKAVSVTQAAGELNPPTGVRVVPQ
jgi:hypothetical protein